MDPRNKNTGMFIEDLLTSADFLDRPMRQRTVSDQLVSLQRLSRVAKDSPEEVLQELAEAALQLCHADSAGVSMETEDEAGNPVSYWVALSGTYAHFRYAMVPQRFMPCGVCLREQRAQLIRLTSRHFKETLNVDVPPVTDGMLLPWNSDGQRATIWVVAHGRSHAFDRADYDVLQVFADFASSIYDSILYHQRSLELASASGASAVHNSAYRSTDLSEDLDDDLYRLPNVSDLNNRQLVEEVGRLSRLVEELTRMYRGSKSIQ